MMPVDWEVRFDPQRMLRERLQRAKDALNNSDLDALFVFRTEDARYLTGYRHHLGPAFIMGNAVTVLSRNHDPILWTMDFEHCKLRMPWLSADQIRPRANFREKVGMKRWAEQVEGLVGSLSGKRVGIDIWDINMENAIREVFPKTEFADGYQSVLMRAKEIKTQDEILCLKIANAITEAALDEGIRALRPGIKECEILGIIWGKMTAMGSEWTQCSNIICSGPYTAPYRRFTSDRIIRNGDLVIMDVGRPDAHVGLRQREAHTRNARSASEVLQRAVQRGRQSASRSDQRRSFRRGRSIRAGQPGPRFGRESVGSAVLQPRVEGRAGGAQGRNGI
jgi:Xaa-Pro dipeptidase